MTRIKGGVFMTTKDLVKLTDWDSESARRELRQIKDSISAGKKRLTIKEYCEYEKLDFEYIWSVLRG